MSTTIPQQIQTLKNNITTLRALVNGVRDPGRLYAIFGDACIYGCKITQGTSAADMVLAIDGQAPGDTQHTNPNANSNPLRHEEYSNIALIYGDVFEFSNSNTVDTANDALKLDAAPTTAGFGRHDLVYAYIGQAGPAVSIITGVASTAVKTSFDATGLDVNKTSIYDPVLPYGTFVLARVYVQTGDTGIANSRIADLRNFKGRMNPISNVGKISLDTGLGLGTTNTAIRRFANVTQNNCPGITMTSSAALGNLFTVTQAGLYRFIYSEIGQGATSYAGVSVNSNQLTTSVQSINIAHVGARIAQTAQGTTKTGANISSTVKLSIGDVLTCHSTIGTYSPETNLTRFEIEKILDY